MQASFIIPLYNCLPLTQAMLASLRATLSPGLAHEIIFVDDGSTDGTREWLKTIGPVLVAGSLNPGPATSAGPTIRSLLNERNLGFAGACNRGAAAATGEFLFFLNNDLVLLPGWLEPMLVAFARFPAAGLVGNVQLNFATGAVDHAGIFFNHKGKPEHATKRGPGLNHYRRVPALTGACFAVRRETWQRLGGFDEGFVNGGEDVDLCLRAGQQGLVNYVARRSVVRHHISASAGRKLRDEQNTVRLVRRWHAVILPQIVRPGSRAVLAAAWEDPRDYADAGLALEAFLHLAGLLPFPSPRLVAAAQTAIDLERARWAHLLEGHPLSPVREIAPPLFPVTPEDPPVY